MKNVNTKVAAFQIQFDKLMDNNDIVSLKKEINRAKSFISTNNLTNEELVILNYSLATSYGFIEQTHFHTGNGNYINQINEKAIYHYRAALDHIDNIDIKNNELYQQLFTNAGNSYDRIGRVLEALRLYDIASKYSEYPMALGNKGLASIFLANNTYDSTHRTIIYHFAHSYLSNAVQYKSKLDIHGSAHEYFIEIINQLNAQFGSDYFNSDLNLNEYSFGTNENEVCYRKWVTNNKLYLNELNDIITNPIVSHDCLHLPNMIFNINDNKVNFYYGLFNQIKQDYISSRYLYYYAINNYDELHLSDRNVQIVLTDTDVHSYPDFCIRTAYKTLYSIFDKIAFFINEYFNLNIPIDKISFRSIWNSKNNNSDSIYNYIEKNFMLKAIYWLSKDLYFENYKITTKPTSKEFYDIRNKMEHRYFVTTFDSLNSGTELSHKLYYKDLENKTLELMKLIRECIIYLSFSVNFEENQKKDSGQYTPAIQAAIDFTRFQ